MAKKVALITIHGMGDIDKDYYKGFEKILKKKLKDHWSQVSFHAVQFAQVFETPQEELWNSMTGELKLNFRQKFLRKILLTYFGDGGSLEHSAYNGGKEYAAVQKEVMKSLENAWAEIGSEDEVDVIVLAYSLGGQILSNYIWDAQHKRIIFKGIDNSPKSDFLRLKSLRNLVTIGCNIPLFVSGLKERTCFDTKFFNNKFSWENYYDPDDVLGWPLKQLGTSYEFINDHPINVGGVLTSWNPLSHLKYWTDKDVVSAMEQMVLNCLKN